MTWAIQGCYTQASVEELAHSHLGSTHQAELHREAGHRGCLSRARLWIAARAPVRCAGRMGRLWLLSLLVLVCFGPAGVAAQVVHPSEVPCPRKRVVALGDVWDLSCAVVADSGVACWGGAAADPTSRGAQFVEVHSDSVGCALARSGKALCWARAAGARFDAQPGGFVQLAVGYGFACGLRPNGLVVCWAAGGYVGSSVLSPPQGEFVFVDAGFRHSCGIRKDRRVECWGENDKGQSTPPQGTFQEVRCGSKFTCGLRTDGTVVCWGDNEYGQAAAPTGGGFIQIDARGGTACGLKVDRSIQCWGRIPSNFQGEGQWAGVAAYDGHVCAWRSDGTLRCWGIVYAGQASAPGGTFVQVSAGAHHTCAVQTDGRLSCWGAHRGGTWSPAEGVFRQISVGAGFECGIRQDGSAECWGMIDPTWVQVPCPEAGSGGENEACWVWKDQAEGRPSGGPFRQLSAGWQVACGLLESGVGQCWGNPYSVEGGRGACLREVSAGWRFSCAIHCDDRLLCSGWGYGMPGYGMPSLLSPDGFLPGTFSHVSAGYGATCALRTDGTVQCWPDWTAVARAPAGAFHSLAVGDSHACALALDDRITCWGSNGFGQAIPPPGPFQQVDAGLAHTCGLRPDGTIECWGGERVLEGIVVQQDTPCVPIPTGDCNGDGFVDIDELVRLVNIALGQERTEASCPSGDANGDGAVSVDEILTAVGRALELG